MTFRAEGTWAAAPNDKMIVLTTPTPATMLALPDGTEVIGIQTPESAAALMAGAPVIAVTGFRMNDENRQGLETADSVGFAMVVCVLPEGIAPDSLPDLPKAN